MARSSRPSPEPPGGRLPFWMSPWLWAGSGLLVGALVVIGYSVGALSGLWPWAAPVGGASSSEPVALPLVGPAKAGDCRPLQVPQRREAGAVVLEGRICLQENGAWTLAPLVAEGTEQ